jgi:hypothetical protein
MVLWIESHRTVVAGDTLVDFGRGLHINPRWLGPDVTLEQVVEGLLTEPQTFSGMPGA